MVQQTPVESGREDAPSLNAEPSATFTPGPWRVDTHVTTSGAGWGYSWEVWSSRDEVVAAAFVSGHSDNFEANARLIAAAPAMYEALREAERFLDYFASGRTYFSGGGTPRTALDQVRAALAQASNPSPQHEDQGQ